MDVYSHMYNCMTACTNVGGCILMNLYLDELIVHISSSYC